MPFIKDLINNKETKNTILSTVEINSLFETLVDKNGKPRREKRIPELKAKEHANVDRQLVQVMLNGYAKIKNDPEAFIKDCVNGTKNMYKGIKKYDEDIKNANNIKISIDRQKYMNDFSKKFLKHDKLYFFQKWFDSKGNKEIEEAKAVLQERFGFSNAMLDVAKYGSQITEKQLISAMKKGEHKFDLDTFNDIIDRKGWNKSKSVMNAYSKFCKKAKLEPDIEFKPPTKPEQVKEENAPAKDITEIKKVADQNGLRKELNLGAEVKGEKNNIQESIDKEQKVVVDELEKEQKTNA